MSAADLAAYRADPVWPARAAAAGTILRELEAETDPAASLDRARRGPPAGPADPRRREPAGLPARPRPSTPGSPTAASWSSTARATPPTTPIRPPSCRRSGLPRRAHGRPMIRRTDPLVLDMNSSAGSSSASSPAPSRAPLVGGTTARGCLPNIVVGILGGLIGGWLATQLGLQRQSRASSPRSSSPCSVDRRPPGPQRDRRPLTAHRPPAASVGQTDARSPRLPSRAMTDAPMPERRPYSPGLEGVIAGETALSYVDGERGRLLYRGYRIGDLVEHGHVPGGREPAVDRRLGPAHRLPTAPVPADRADRPARPAGDDQADGRAAHGGLGLGRDAGPALAADRRAGPRADRRSRRRRWPRSPGCGRARSRSSRIPRSTSSRASSTSSTGERPDPATARALDAYFIVGAEHGFNASTFTARVVTSTRSDIASAVAAAIGTMKGPLHGGAPSEVVDQLNQIGSADARRGVGPRDARSRRAADGLRPSRLSRLRPAGRRAAQGRRGDAQPAGLAPAGDRGRGRRRCASSPRSTRSGRSRRTSSSTRRPSSWASA